MSRLRSILFVALAVFAVTATAQDPSEAAPAAEPAPSTTSNAFGIPMAGATGEGKTAIRCAVFYLLMSKVPAMADKVDQLNAIIDDLGELATSRGVTDAQMGEWAVEFMQEASDAAKGPDSDFNEKQAQVCQALLDSMSAVSTSP